jgi:hypothetical protein
VRKAIDNATVCWITSIDRLMLSIKYEVYISYHPNIIYGIMNVDKL